MKTEEKQKKLVDKNDQYYSDDPNWDYECALAAQKREADINKKNAYEIAFGNLIDD